MNAATLLALPALVLLVPCAVLCAQALAARLPRRGLSIPDGIEPTMAVLVPAHDERLSIAAVVADVQVHLRPGDRVLVVADNCTDDTAERALRAGAEVVERNDPSRRGKGYALDFGVRHLRASPPDVVIVIDADCRVVAGSLRQLAAASLALGAPMQAHYAMTVSPSATLGQQIAAFAWLVKNLVRPLGMLNLRLPCQLMGAGMAFPWAVLAARQLAGGQIVEDLKLGIDCALAGRPARFLPKVKIQSAFAPSRQGARSQRVRWEHGHLALIWSEVAALLITGLRRRRGDIMALALDLAVPPVALLVLLVGAGWLTCLAAWASGVGSATAVLALFTLDAWLVAVSVLLSWERFGRDTISLAKLAGAPLYALHKVPIYLGFLRRRQKEWVRTKRD